MIKSIQVSHMNKNQITLTWEKVSNVDTYEIFWSDAATKEMVYESIGRTNEPSYTYFVSTHQHHYFKVVGLNKGVVIATSEVFQTPVGYRLQPQLETLNRGLIAVKTDAGIFLTWRLMANEVDGYNGTGLTGATFEILKNEAVLAEVINSTNYMDETGHTEDWYQVSVKHYGVVYPPCEAVQAFKSGQNYLEMPLCKPADGVTPKGVPYTYHANDMSVGDVDGDGDYELIVKWDPDNSKDVSQKGYTGPCYIDCYKLSGQLLWRLDLGPNIRSGAHYTQFMVYDFNGDGRAEMSVKTAPGTKMIRYDTTGNVVDTTYVTMPQKDIDAGFSHTDDYVCSSQDYETHLVKMFRNWPYLESVLTGAWPKTLEACFGINDRYAYPLNETDAKALVHYFIHTYAPSRSDKNVLSDFEGFIYEGPEYLTMLAGDGIELETIYFPYPREDDGLMWGDYAMPRIEPCNRVDRFLSGVAYLDGERPYLIVARGYYTRTTLVAYDFFDNRHRVTFEVDSGHVPMDNPFKDNPHGKLGIDPVYGSIAGQGNHSLATADVDGDGKQEIIYGACVIDHDGSLLYSSFDKMPDGSIAKLGHGDAMHVANINPNRPGYEIFSVFEGGVHAPYGFALRDAKTGAVIFGEYATIDLGRCMIGKIEPSIPGYQVWVHQVYDAWGQPLALEPLGTNQSIRYATDLTTQILDGADYVHGHHQGIISDYYHGIMLKPEGMATNNGTKGNPCLVVDLFGDFREELILRTKDSNAIRIYTNATVTPHKLMTFMHDVQYRTGVAWQNTCYNQPGYPSFYYGNDMDFAYVRKDWTNPVYRLFLVGDSTVWLEDAALPKAMGWGQALVEDKQKGLAIYNHAMAGRSTKTFLEEGRWQKVIAQITSGDFIMISFGHNDMKADDLKRYTQADGAYRDHLETMISQARQKGAIPILVTPLSCCNRDDIGQIQQLHQAYTFAMKAVAKHHHVPLIDLESYSRERLNTLGKAVDEVDYLDGVHLSTIGAKRIADWLKDTMTDMGLPFTCPK